MIYVIIYDVYYEVINNLFRILIIKIKFNKNYIVERL